MSIAEGKSKALNLSLLTVILMVIVVLIWVGVRIVLPDNSTMFAGTTPDDLGVKSGKLIACPNTPNCVSSQSQDDEHQIDPISYNSTSTEAIANLKNIIQNQPGGKIIAQTDNYLYAQFTSHWMGFVDDVEFYLNEEEKKIEIRSASRLGESDLGVNRQRIESIRLQLIQNF